MPKAAEIRTMSDDELAHHVAYIRRNLFNLRFRHATGELENTAGMRTAKRELARALTVARERGVEVDRHGGHPIDD
jgi:large subunit ribosomal protein L29